MYTYHLCIFIVYLKTTQLNEFYLDILLFYHVRQDINFIYEFFSPKIIIILIIFYYNITILFHDFLLVNIYKRKKFLCNLTIHIIITIQVQNSSTIIFSLKN